MQKKILSAVQILFITVLSLFTVFIFVLNLMFLKSDASPSLFGYNIFLLSTENMEPQIMKGSAIFASTEKIEMLEDGNVILCYIGESKTKAVMRIRGSEAVDGITYYTVAEDREGSVGLSVSKDNILARCIYSSSQVGAFIVFSKSTKGIFLFIVLPCTVLIAMQIINIIRSKKRSREISIPVPEFEGLDELTLFDNQRYTEKNHELNARNQSLADNFMQKTENSAIPYLSSGVKKQVRPTQSADIIPSAADSISKIAKLEQSGRAKSILNSLDDVALKHVERELEENPPLPVLPSLASDPPKPIVPLATETYQTPIKSEILEPAVSTAQVPQTVAAAVKLQQDQIESPIAPLPPAAAPVMEEKNITPEPPADTARLSLHDDEVSVVSEAVISEEMPANNIRKDAEPEPAQTVKPASQPELRKTVRKRPKRSANIDLEDLMKLIDDKNL